LQAQLQIAPVQTVPVPIIDGRLLSQMQIGNWSTDAGGLDVLQHIPGLDGHQLTYPELRQQATAVTDDGRMFAVASLADIAASKRAAGRQKDVDALPELERLLAESPPPETVMAAASESRHRESRTAGNADTFLLLARSESPAGQRTPLRPASGAAGNNAHMGNSDANGSVR
jgi:hypothetical protein